MLSISTLPEALAELEKFTGTAWTDSQLFDLVTRYGIELHAAPPISAQTTIQEFVNGRGLVEKFNLGPGHSPLAVLFPWQVGQLWISGETVTSHPKDHNQVKGEFQFFTKPVHITRDQVRIRADTLLEICSKLHPAPSHAIAATDQIKPLEVTIASWKVTKPKRQSGYIPALYAFLMNECQAGRRKPTASDFCDAMRLKKHPDISEVMSDCIKYQTSTQTRTADLDAIRKAIARMTAS